MLVFCCGSATLWFKGFALNEFNVKYFLISLIVFLVCVAPAWASFTFVNAQGANSSSSSSLATTTWSSTTGDMVGCSIAMFGQTISTVKDVNNLSFTVQSVVTSGGSGNQYTAYD